MLLELELCDEADEALWPPELELELLSFALLELELEDAELNDEAELGWPT